MKNTITLLLSAFTLANCQETHPAKITIRLKDDAGVPIPNYMVHTGTYQRTTPDANGEVPMTGPAKQTGANGQVTFEMQSVTGMIGINFFQGLSAGYYLTTIPNHQFQRVENGRWVPEDPLIEVVLKRKRKPIPMYAKSYIAGSSESLWMPAADKEYPYDLEVGDWVAPLGIGKSGDMVFTRTFEEFPSGDYKQVIRVSFPGPKDGLIAFDKDPSLGSELASAHMAPEDGYIPLLEKRRTVEGGKIADDAKRDRNYYFRVRSKVDDKGRVVSAHYGKIYGDFMSFTYYLNPTPNDHNVEFDPKRNLFKGDSDAYSVTRP